MTRRHRLALLVITFLPVVALLAASGLYLKHEVDRLAQHANVLIAGELQRRFKREVSVGKARVDTPGVAVLENIRVAKERTLDQGEMASVSRIVVRYDWRALILGGRGAESVSEVVVSDPNLLLIRRRDGTFNITELLKPPPGPRRPPFRGKVRITGGDVRFLDYAVRPRQTPVPIYLKDLAGSIDAAKHPIYAFDGLAKGKRGQFATASFRGRYHGLTRRILVRVTAADVSASRLAPYLWKSNNIQVLGGMLNTSVSLDVRRMDGRYTLSAAGGARVGDATLRLSVLKTPVTGISGAITVAGNRASGDVTGSFAGARVRATGAVADSADPTLDIVLDSPSLDTGRLIASTTFLDALSQFAASGRGAAHARLTGGLSNLTVDATARVPRASVQGVSVEDVRVSALYRPGVVDLRSLQSTVNGATVRASGRIATSPTTALDLRGRFDDLDLERLPVKVQYPVSGKASGTFALTGPSANPAVSMAARVANGSAAGVPFDSVEGDLRVVGSKVIVNDLRVSGVFEGSVQASGVVSDSTFDLSAAAESIDIDSLARALGKSGYGGTAFFNGRVSGDLKSPRVQGLAEIFNGRAEDYSIDHALVAFAGDRNSVTVSEGLVQMYPAELRFSGEASGLSADRVTFAGKADVRRLEMTKLLGLLKRELDVTGTVLGHFAFSGVYLPQPRPDEQRLTNVTASGSLSLEDATAFGYPVSTASATLGYLGNTLELTKATVTSDGARLVVDGSLSTDTRAVDAGFSLTNFDLSRLREYVGDYFVLAGTASAKGKILGPLEDPNATIDARIDGLAVNYEKFDRADASFSYDNGVFGSFSVDIARSGQTFHLSGADYDPATNCLVSSDGKLTDVSVPDVFDIVRASPFFSSKTGKRIAEKLGQLPRLTSGRLNGTFALSGCLESPEGGLALPDGTLNLTAANVGLDVQTVDSIQMRASAKSGVVTLDTFEVVSGDTSLVATGERAYANGNLDLEVRTENVMLSSLGPWLGENAPRGTLSATFDITGAAGAPEIVGSVDIIGPSYRGFTFEHLRAPAVQILANRVEIPKILLTARGHQVTATASVPWDWLDFTIRNDEPIAVSADLSKQDLSVLSVFWPLVDAAETTGVIEEGEFHFAGSLLDPQMTGSLKVKGGTIALTSFTNTFTNVTADLDFTGDLITVNAMSASSSEGGSVHVVPGGYITVGILGTSEVNVAIAADRLTVGEKNLFGLKEDVRTRIDAGLSVMGPPSSATVADAAVEGKTGGVTLSRARFAFVLPAKPVEQETGARTPAPVPTPKPGETPLPVLAVNPTLNFSLRLGDEVEIAPPRMSLIATGGGRLAGTLMEPKVDLGLEIRSGEINLATARLRVAPGGAINLAYVPPGPPDVRVEFQSSASVFAVNSLGQRQRYQITMQVSGQAANPQINLTCSPPGLTRAEMLAALGHVPALFASAEVGLQAELANMLTAVGTSTLLAPIESIFVQKLGFEQFNLEFSPVYPLSIYVSRQFFGNFYIAFYRQLTGSFASTQDVLYQVVMSYRLKGVYQFSVGADNQQTLTIQIGYAKPFR